MGALLFIGLWVIVGLVLFVIAMSGGPAAARENVLHTQTRRGRRVVLVVVTLIYLALGVAVPALVIAGNEADDQAGRAGIELTAAEERGRELFGENCAQCHTLAAANAVGTVGPDLDVTRPPAPLVLDAVLNGRARGLGRMPAALLSGQDARDVAQFVGRVAGRE